MYCRGHKGFGRAWLERFGCERIFGDERTGLIHAKVISPLFAQNTCTDRVIPLNKYISDEFDLCLSSCLAFRRLRQSRILLMSSTWLDWDCERPRGMVQNVYVPDRVIQ